MTEVLAIALSVAVAGSGAHALSVTFGGSNVYECDSTMKKCRSIIKRKSQLKQKGNWRKKVKRHFALDEPTVIAAEVDSPSVPGVPAGATGGSDGGSASYGGGNGSNGPSPVPLPAAGWMLLAGVGGLAAMRRRNRG